MCDPFMFAHLQCGLEPRNLDGNNLGMLVPSARQTIRPKITLTSICMEVTFKCHLLGLSLLLGLADFTYM